jgi:hypothetical protein
MTTKARLAGQFLSFLHPDRALASMGISWASPTNVLVVATSTLDTVPRLTPRLWATSRWVRPRVHQWQP